MPPISAAPTGENHGRSTPPRELPRLQDSDRKALRVVGSFRVVNAKEIASPAVRRLLDKGLIHRRTMHPGKGRPPQIVLSLTRKGRDTLEAAREPGDRQRYWTGVVKPQEIEHDTCIYTAYQKEAAQIEAAGGKIERVVIDYEFKADINAQLNQPSSPEQSARRQEIAEEYGLPVVDDKLLLPDLRIEYLDADGQEQHLDVEVLTQHYRGSHLAGKAQSGFRLHSVRTGSRRTTDPRAAVRDDHHLSFL